MEPSRDPRIERVITVMEQRIEETWRVQDLAAIAELSTSRFAHLFRQTTGVSPVRYMQQLRIDRASQLLTRTSLSVGEIMRLVGCPDPSHFARSFRSQFGVGPNEYRRTHGRLQAVYTR